MFAFSRSPFNIFIIADSFPLHAQVGPGARTMSRGVVFIFVRALASVKGLRQLMHLQVLYVL